MALAVQTDLTAHEPVNMSSLHHMLFSRKKIRPILQTEAAECGLASLAMVANWNGHEVDLNILRQRFGVSARGMIWSAAP